ncbi:hypothetical protein EG329_003922 [Mollisiaceae sp. DMI_Dod_QoI]|nr:hypothetical protein EG329_003922 [Helotiales sp. DMI_Dod_QoI]
MADETGEAIKSLAIQRLNIEGNHADQAAALLYAAEWGDLDAVHLLIDHGADIGARNPDQSHATALHLAARYGHCDIINILLSSGCDISWKDDQGATAFHKAAQGGKCEAMKLLVAKGSDITARENGGRTAVHLAARRGLLGVIQLLRDMNANVMGKDSKGRTPLHHAALNGEIEAMKLLVDLGGDLGCEDDSRNSVLHSAAATGQAKVVQYLVESHISLESVNQRGQTALAVAAEYGQIEVLRLLVDKAANIATRDLKDYTPLHFAARFQHCEVIQLLIDKGADIEARDSRGYSPLAVAVESGCGDAMEVLAECGADLLTRDNKGETILHLAASTDNIRAARFLIAHRIDINAQDKNGQTALTLAVMCGRLEVVRLLVDNSADMTIVDERGWSTLHHAAQLGLKAIVEILVKKGANPAMESTTGERPLDLALQANREDVAELLREIESTWSSEKHKIALFISATEHGQLDQLRRFLDSGVEVDSTDEDGWKALLAAAVAGQEDAVEFLLKQGATIDEKGVDGETALWWAARHGHERIVQRLLEQGAQIDAVDSSGQSPLSAAAQMGHEPVVHALLRRGANCNAVTSYGMAALSFAKQRGHLTIVNMLLDSGAVVEPNSEAGGTASSSARKENHPRAPFMLLRRAAEAISESANKVRRLSDWKVIKDLSKSDEYIIDLILFAGNGNVTSIERLVRFGISPNSMDAYGRIPIVSAAEHGKNSAVAALLRAGADINLSDKEGKTCLHWAAAYGHLSTVRLLAREGARIDAKDNGGWSPLSIASAHRQDEVVQELLHLGADIESKDINGSAPLHFAADLGYVSTVSILLDKGADIEASGMFGWTPLFFSVAFSVASPQQKTAKYLLERNANIEAKCEGGLSPLFVATATGNESTVGLLLEHGADPNCLSKDGKTTLMSAVVGGRSTIVKMLIETGANVDIRDNDKRTSISYAKEYGREPLVKLLSSATSIRHAHGLSKSANAFVAQDRYTYEPLPTGSFIRLIELHPGKAGDIISFDLHNADLSKVSAYEALSYEWGQGANDFPVECNGARLHVHANLKAALEVIRSPARSRTLWIDAICINQEDITERGRQVVLMTEIYQEARTVLMWLGTGTWHTKTAFANIPAFKSAFELLDEGKPELAEPSKEATETLHELLHDAMDEETIMGMEELCNHTYFTRAWIFQEILLAGSRGRMLCGSYQCDWGDMKKALLAFNSCSELLQTCFKSIEEILVCERSFAKHGGLKFEEASTALMQLDASDSRDKIYATLGILGRTMRGMQSDYSLTVQEVYTKAARHIIQQEQNLWFWSIANREKIKSVPNLPSWVPDWTVEQKNKEVRRVQSGKILDIARLGERNFAGLFKGEMITTPTALHLNGYLMDRVVFGKSIKIEEDVYRGLVKQVFAVLGKDLFEPYPWENGDSNLATLWKLISRYSNFRDEDGEDEIITFLAWKIATDIDIPITIEDLPSTLRLGVQDLNRRLAIQDDLELSIYRRMEVCHNPQDVVYTANGHFGLTNLYTAEEGLVLAILGGGPFITLLREQGDHQERWYKYVDNILVADLAESAWEKLEDLDKDAKVERIEIR